VIALARSATRLENLRQSSEHAGRLFLFGLLGECGNVLSSVWQPAAGGLAVKLSEAR
jgi:hypothetical protein